MRQALADIGDLCALQAKAKGITLSITPPASDVVVAADARRFQQILLNLVTNAIKFTGSCGSVDITCDSDVNTARVRVKNTGIGIGSIDADRVFEPFVQINPELTAPMQQGVGLGLSISRDLARTMHGDLTLESIEGVGSEFILTIPAAANDYVTPAAAAVLDWSATAKTRLRHECTV